jgi:hypothetical protein
MIRCDAFVKNVDNRCKQGISSGCAILVEDTLFRVCRNHLNTWERKSLSTKALIDQMAFFAKDTGEVRNTHAKDGDTIINIDNHQEVEQMTLTIPAQKVYTFKAYKIIGKENDGRPRTFFPMDVKAPSLIGMHDRCMKTLEANPTYRGILVKIGRLAFIVRRDGFTTQVNDTPFANASCVRFSNRTR